VGHQGGRIALGQEQVRPLGPVVGVGEGLGVRREGGRHVLHGDVGDADFAQLLQIEQGQALGEQLAIDHALAEAGDHAETHALRKLVHRRADALEVMRIDVLQAVPEHDPVDAPAGRLGPLRAAVPDQLGVKARASDLIIFRMDLANQIEVDKAVIHRSDQRIRLEDRGLGDRIVAARSIDNDYVG